MAWYDIPGVNCVFSLDHNSRLNSSSASRVYYSNDVNRYLNVNSPSTTRVRKEFLTGTEIKNFEFIGSEAVKSYLTLRLENAFLTFQTPPSMPEEFTLFLKTKLNGPSIFLDSDNTSGGYGPCFNYETLGQADTVWYTWRMSGFTSGQEYSPSVRERGKNSISTLIIKGSRITKEALMITDYGTYVLNEETSTVFGSGGIFKDTTLIQMGYSSGPGTWDPNANIVAYGLFDKDLSLEQLDKVIKDIDNEFLFSDETIKLNKSNIKLDFSFKNYFKKTSIYNSNHHLTSTTKILKPLNIDYKTTSFVPEIPQIDIESPKRIDLKDFVYEEEVPVQTELYLLERHSGQILKRTRSNTQGFFEFKDLDPELEYIIISPDIKYQYKSVIKDYDLKGSKR